TTEGLDADKYGCVKTNAETGETSRKGIFCGGDAATGSATVILAMAAGRKAARAIDEYIKQQPA
ncbi:MAG: dihydropyrimidine dehydrogenase, partial [Bacteroidales bacterium]|nr:dihydropyrimidine dehydrogenase [Bacteroidales bacterium]